MPSPIQLQLLKIEIITDPLARSYSGMTNAAVTMSLNTKNRSRNKEFMLGWEVGEEIVASEYGSLTDQQRLEVLSYTSASVVKPFGFAAIVVKKAFGVGSTTIQNLIAARVETISRAEELGLGTVTEGGVEHVRQ